MSYEIVKNIRVEKNSDNEFYHVRINSASNNVYPHYYSVGTYGEKLNWTKEEAEKTILLDFLHGNLQRGQSKYKKTVDELLAFHGELLQKYYKLDRVYSKASRRCWRSYTKGGSKRHDQACQLADKLRAMRDKEAKDVLYNYMIENTGSVSARTVEPFVVIDKFTGCYCVKITKTRYFTSHRRHVLTSKSLWNRIHKDSWWKEHFIIEQVSAMI